MTLLDECNWILIELEKRGIKYPDELYVRVKLVKTTLHSIQNHFLGFGEKDKEELDIVVEALKNENQEETTS